MTWRLTDPGHSALRKAARAALVMTALTALGHIAGDAAFAMFASYGAVALLLFADFGGPLRTRFGLGLAFTATSAGLVTVGTLVSGNLPAVVALLFAVGFVVTFAAVFGGYAAAGGKGLLLAAALSAMVPAGADELLHRVAGWALAGLVGSVALVLLWPEQSRPRVRLELGSIASDLAAVVRAASDGTPTSTEKIMERVTALREGADAALSRPGGPRSRDRALLYLMDELGRTAMFVRRLDDASATAPLNSADRAALAASADAIDAAASVLAGDPLDPPRGPVQDARRTEEDDVRALLHRSSTHGTGAGGGAPEGATLTDRLDVLFPVRMVTYQSLSISTNALVAVGRPPGDTSFEFQIAAPTLQRGTREVLSGFVSTIRTNLRPASRWFRSSARVGTALAVSAAIAATVDPKHAFWVVLGTLSVLRSSVVDTGATALQSMIGTLIGFAGATGIMLAFGDHRSALWVMFPLLVFAAGFLPSAVNFLAGQAAFTVLVVVLFNLSGPVGWELGVVRLERVALGAAVSVLVAVVIWPRGVNHGIARAVAGEYRSAADYLRSAFDAVLRADGTPAELERRHADALTARAFAESELGDLMNSHGAKHVAVDSWADLVARPGAALIGADSLRSAASRQGPPARQRSAAPSVTDATEALDVAAELLTDSVRSAADHLDAAAGHRPDRKEPSPSPATPASATTSAAAALADARSAVVALLDDTGAVATLSDHQVVGVVSVLEWLTFLADLHDDVAAEWNEACAAAGRSWWR